MTLDAVCHFLLPCPAPDSAKQERQAVCGGSPPGVSVMRIIAGRAKGARLAGFKGSAIRPTLDRVKESLFSQISPVVEGAAFLDLFAGTGNIGIEALSRGAAKVVFVESSREAQELICKNLQKCRFDDTSGSGPSAGLRGECGWELLRSDAFRAIDVLRKRDTPFDLVYVDPPFDDDLYNACLQRLADSCLLKADTLVIVEHYHKKELRENYDIINLIRKRRFGDTCLSFYCSRQPDGRPDQLFNRLSNSNDEI